jgi:glycosyltransferase involved in cell wall biosynthesis
MIVKNEEKFLEDCLKSVQELVQQIVIIDTGCTDGTLDIAKKYGAEIHEFQWVNDFSAARNESIKYATGDWILWLDADERLMDETKGALETELTRENEPIAYTVPIKNIRDGGTNYFMSDANRLFRNHQGIKFDGRIHEQITYSLKRLKGKERPSNLMIFHLGYGFEKEQAQKKYKRNEQLLLRMVKEEPKNAYAHYTLGQNFGLQDKNTEALKHYQIALNLGNLPLKMNISLLNVTSEALLKLNNPEKAKKFALRSVSIVPMQVAGYYNLFKIAEYENDEMGISKWLKKMIETNSSLAKSGKSISSDVLVDDFYLRQLAARKMMSLKQHSDALFEINYILNKDKTHLGALELKAECLTQTGDLRSAVDILTQIIKLSPKFRYYELLGKLLIKMELFDQAIQILEKGRLLEPRNTGLLRLLVGLYGKTGKMDKAEKLLTVLNSIQQS